MPFREISKYMPVRFTFKSAPFRNFSKYTQFRDISKITLTLLLIAAWPALLQAQHQDTMIMKAHKGQANKPHYYSINVTVGNFSKTPICILHSSRFNFTRDYPAALGKYRIG